MKRHQYSRHTAADGSVTLVYHDHHANNGGGGYSKRVFPDQATFDAWWYLCAGAPSQLVFDDYANAPKLDLRHEVPFDAALAACVPTRRQNAAGILRRAEERLWLSQHAAYRPGDRAVFADGTQHIGDRAEVVIIEVNMDHSHPTGHTAACWHPNRITYEVATGYDPKTGHSTLRWAAKANHLTRPRKAA